MKLYLSSYRIPTVDELIKLIGKPLGSTRLALIPNAKDYYAERAWKIKVDAYVNYFVSLGITVDVVDLRTLNNSEEVINRLKDNDIVWGAGGNTFCLRYEMRRSNFETAIKLLLEDGMVYAGDSAGALVAGQQIGGLGIETVDTPEFAESIITEGLGLIPHIIIPHADNPEFASITDALRISPDYNKVIELKDSQAVIFENAKYRIVQDK